MAGRANRAPRCNGGPPSGEDAAQPGAGHGFRCRARVPVSGRGSGVGPGRGRSGADQAQRAGFPMFTMACAAVRPDERSAPARPATGARRANGASREGYARRSHLTLLTCDDALRQAGFYISLRAYAPD